MQNLGLRPKDKLKLNVLTRYIDSLTHIDMSVLTVTMWL